MASSPATTSSTTAAPLAPPQPGTVPPGYKFIAEGSASILYEANEEAGDKGEPVFYNKVQVLNRDLSIRMITQFVRTRARERATPKGNRAKRRAAAQAAEADAAAEAAAASGAGSEAPAASSEGGNGTVATACAAPPDASAAAAASGSNVLSLSSAELDAKLRAEAPERGIRILDALAATGLRSIRYFKEIPGVKQVSKKRARGKLCVPCLFSGVWRIYMCNLKRLRNYFCNLAYYFSRNLHLHIFLYY